MNEELLILASIACGVTGGTLSALATAWLYRRKRFAEGRSIEVRGELQIVDAAVKIADQLRHDMDRLNRRLQLIEGKNEQLEQQVTQLRDENRVLTDRLKQVEMENEQLRARCSLLEQENSKLQQRHTARARRDPESRGGPR